MQQIDSEPNTIDQGRTACGGTLPKTDGYPSTVYRGERIYFCTQACLDAFKKDPTRFLAGKIKHPIE